jgi:phenylalanyl-tRNA synthetase alpha subunit
MTAKATKKTKNEIMNISSELFEQMAVEACKKNGILKIEALFTSFDRMKTFEEGEQTITSFNVSISTEGKTYNGRSTHPVIAIEEAIKRRAIELGIVRINSQALIEHEQQQRTDNSKA